MTYTIKLKLTEEQAEFLHNAVCGVPDDQRDDGDEETLEYLLSELNSILNRFEMRRDKPIDIVDDCYMSYSNLEVI